MCDLILVQLLWCCLMMNFNVSSIVFSLVLFHSNSTDCLNTAVHAHYTWQSWIKLAIWSQSVRNNTCCPVKSFKLFLIFFPLFLEMSGTEGVISDIPVLISDLYRRKVNSVQELIFHCLRSHAVILKGSHKDTKRRLLLASRIMTF